MNENNGNQGSSGLASGTGQLYIQSPHMDGFVSTQSLVYMGGATGISYTFQEGTTIAQGKTKRLGPKLYFSYVKSKLNKTQTKKLKGRLQKLQSLVKNADEHGQKALYEEFSKMLVIAVRESEAASCGYDVFVNRQDIEKFMFLVTEDEKSTRNPIRFKKLEEFPRPVPAKVGKVIKSVQAKGLFDELHVLYLDYTGEEIKSTKEKIREKDPVLFGRFTYDPNRFFFITDWIDEHCDLTLSKFVDILKKDDKEYETQQLQDITPEYLENIKKEMKEREERLKNTNMGNFRSNMAEEDKAELTRLKAENAKLREDERFRSEDKEIAIEKALRDRQNWREEASKEKGQENLIDPIVYDKKPWYKRFF